MLGKTVLLCTYDRAGSRRLSHTLRGAGNEVVSVETASAAADLIVAGAVDLVVVDGSDLAAADLVLAAARGRVPTIVTASQGDAESMRAFVCDRGVDCFLSGDELDREVVVTVEKILRKDLFGIEKYLPAFGVDLSISEVRCAEDRDTVVECIGDYVEWLGAGREARRAIAAIADELITNAVYDAPRDAHGRAKYHAADRRQKIQLEPGEYVTVRWGTDGSILALSVTDWFGALEPETIRAGLRRCLGEGDQIEQKAGGAGLGLYTALSYSTEMVINVDRGERTEIIAIVDLRRRGHGARRAGASLHLFHDDSLAGATEVADGTPQSIEISDSMLMDVRETLAPSKRRAEVVPLVQPKRAPSQPRARGSSPPPNVGDPIGAGTACGLLRGVCDTETALRIALRFVAQHYQAAIAYDVGKHRLEACFAEGDVVDWSRIRELGLDPDTSASVVALARGGRGTEFRPRRPHDYRLAMLAAGDSEAPGVTIPLHIGGELRWILYGARPRAEAPLTDATLEAVRLEVEACLQRLDPDEPTIEVGYI
jgi:hypothetical protein